MSDAKGNQSDPVDDRPAEAGETSLAASPQGGAELRDASDRSPVAAETAGEHPQGVAAEEPVAAPAEPAPVEPAPATEEPSPVAKEPSTPDVEESAADASPTPAGTSESAPAAEPAVVDDTTSAENAEPARSEPDYAALAAELEEFENRTRGAEPAETSPEPEAGPEAEKPAPGSSWFEKAGNTFRATDPEEPTAATVVAPSVTPSEPVAAPAPVFVETPEPPRKRGNRLAALLIAVPATLTFAVLYLAAALGYGFVTGYTTVDNVLDSVVELATTPAFWVPIVAFLLAFWLLGVIVNRGRAAWWVVLGLFVGLAAYAGYVFGPVLTHPFWMVTASAAREAVVSALLHPVAIASFVIGREVTVWFGAWAARRGRKMARLNAEDRAEYDRVVDAAE